MPKDSVMPHRYYSDIANEGITSHLEGKIASLPSAPLNGINRDVIASEAWQSHAISSASEIAFELVYLAKTRQEDCEISSEA